MLPWERQIYVDMLVQYLEEEKERMKSQKASKNGNKQIKTSRNL